MIKNAKHEIDEQVTRPETDKHEIDGHENDEHKIGIQEIHHLKIDYITMQHAILFKTMAEHKSKKQDKLYINIK